MKCVFIYNPESGRGIITQRLGFIIKKLNTIYDYVDVHPSQSGEDITNAIIDASTKYDAIIFSGGDGTFNRVCSGLSRCEKRPTLGYIPTGTANDIARNLKIPRNINGALKVILDQKAIMHDVGKVNDDYFMYVCALGACTGTPYTTKQTAKKFLGRLAYVRDGLDEFFSPNVHDVKITSNGTSYTTKSPLILVMNTRTVGGMPFNRYGHLNDGMFDVVIVNNGNGHGRFNIIKYFISGLFGSKRKKYVIFLRLANMDIEVSDKLTWDIDGERGPVGNVHIDCISKHLSIFVPKKKK